MFQANDQSTQSISRITKKLYCKEHGQKFAFKCKYSKCQQPFICSNKQCIENHMHEQDEIHVAKFNTDNLVENFKKVQKMIDCQNIEHSAKTIKKFIDQIKNNLRHVYTNLKTFNQAKKQICSSFDTSLSNDFINKINLTCELQASIKNDIQSIKAKIAIQSIKSKQFNLKDKIRDFLITEIPFFKWQSAHEIYSTKDDLLSCQKFHEKLQGKNRMLFLFIGEEQIAGSFYNEFYPSLKDKGIYDMNSFVFVSRGGQQQQDGSNMPIYIQKFQPQKDAKFHLIVSPKNYIQHGMTQLDQGLRTFQRNLDVIDINLPCFSYKASQNADSINLRLIVKYFMILQIPQDK